MSFIEHFPPLLNPVKCFFISQDFIFRINLQERKEAKKSSPISNVKFIEQEL